MSVKVWRFVTLMLVALNTGGAFAHVLELPGKMRLGPRDYATVQQIYKTFGPIGALLEPGSVLAAALLVFRLRGRPAFSFTLVGTGLLASALVIWLAFVAPMNQKMREEWTSLSMPRNWARVRNQWEFSHAVRFILQVGGLAAILASFLSELPDKTRGEVSTESEQESAWVI